MNSTTFEQTIAQPVAQFGNSVNLGRHRFGVIGETIELDVVFVLIQHGITCRRIEIAGLSDGTGIDDESVIAFQLVAPTAVLPPCCIVLFFKPLGPAVQGAPVSTCAAVIFCRV